MITARVFGDFRTAFASPEGTFASIWGTGRSFLDVDPAADKSFSDLYSLTSAGILRARLMWGETSGALDNHIDWFEITAPEIEARYLQVRVEIEDPTEDAYLYLYTLNMMAYTF